MNSKAYSLVFVAACSIAFFPAQAYPRELKLIPEPKQVKLGEGEFVVTSETRIVINAAHSAEDRTAAEMLASEIESAGGEQVPIVISRSLPKKSGTIYLARLGDDRALGSLLESSQLGIDDKFDQEGYVLAVRPKRIIVSALTGQGLFYAVQTLRQLTEAVTGRTPPARPFR